MLQFYFLRLHEQLFWCNSFILAHFHFVSVSHFCMTYVYAGFHLHDSSEGSFGTDKKNKKTGRLFTTFHVATVKTSTLKFSAHLCFEVWHM